MGSISKHQKSSSCNIDRISYLPNNLITRILSFLPTKDAVGTSALSTHWNQQWTFITHLHFDIGLSQSNTSTTRAMFVNFVYRVLLYKASRLELFRLDCADDYGATHVTDWLSAAVSRRVREVDLDLPMDGVHLGPRCLFTSKTLVVLKLGTGFILRVPKIITLESLKLLDLNSVEFEDNESFSRLVSGCPVLEELQMYQRMNERLNVIHISSVELKRLILQELFFPEYSDNAVPLHFEIVLNTPSLQYIEHVDYGMPHVYNLGTPDCLDEAHFEFVFDNDQIVLNPMEDLVVAISSVRCLYLSECFFKALQYSCCRDPNYDLPKFPHLTDLTIDALNFHEDLSFFTAFLESSPQLASLSFALPCSDVSWDPPTSVPLCMLYNLKVITVCRFSGLELHLSMVKYFLEKTKCLKELILPGMEEQEAEVIKKVLMLPRAAKSCKIVLS